VLGTYGWVWCERVGRARICLAAGDDSPADVPRGAYQGKLWTDGDAVASRRPYDKSNIANDQPASKQHCSSHTLLARGPAGRPLLDQDGRWTGMGSCFWPV
jgi:hypothetical protein